MNIGPEKHKKAEERMHFSCSAFNTMVPPVQYQGGDWFMDTGGHAAYNAGIVYSTRPALSTYHIIIGNGAPRQYNLLVLPLFLPPARTLSLNNVMISPDLIKNLISVPSFTHDNWVFVEFDMFGFSIKDLLTKMVLLRCDSIGDLYLLRKNSHSTTGNNIFIVQLMGDLWHAHLGHPGDSQLHQILCSFDFHCSKDTHTCDACRLGKNVRVHSNKVDAFPFTLLHCDI
jgi:hypothetical protein